MILLFDDDDDGKRTHRTVRTYIHCIAWFTFSFGVIEQERERERVVYM